MTKIEKCKSEKDLMRRCVFSRERRLNPFEPLGRQYTNTWIVNIQIERGHDQN